MRHIVAFGISALILGLAAGCAGPQTRQFEVRVDDAFYTVTETRGGGPFGNGEASLSVRVGGANVACAALPCAEEVRAARGKGGIDDFRRPPPGADLTAE